MAVAAAQVRLTPELMAQAEAVINHRTVTGNRYSEQSNREVDTEVFAS